jgi:hypothetical protein
VREAMLTGASGTRLSGMRSMHGQKEKESLAKVSVAI